MTAARIDTVTGRRDGREDCGGTRVLDLAICLILAVTAVSLLLLAL